MSDYHCECPLGSPLPHIHCPVHGPNARMGRPVTAAEFMVLGKDAMKGAQAPEIDRYPVVLRETAIVRHITTKTLSPVKAAPAMRAPEPCSSRDMDSVAVRHGTVREDGLVLDVLRGCWVDPREWDPGSLAMVNAVNRAIAQASSAGCICMKIGCADGRSELVPHPKCEEHGRLITPDEETLARALFGTDPRVQFFIDTVTDRGRPVARDATPMVEAFQRAWDRDECGWATDARQRAQEIVAQWSHFGEVVR